MSRVKFVKFDNDDDDSNNDNNNYDNSKKNNKQKKKGKKSNNRTIAVAPINKVTDYNYPKKKKGGLKTFLLSFMTTILVLFAIAGVLAFAYNKIFYTEDKNIAKYDNNNAKYEENKTLLGGKDQYNFAFFGIDEGEQDPRTDFMMIGSYDRKSNKVRLMSIPRDTLTYMSEDRIKDLEANGIPTTTMFPKSGRMKMAEVHHHATSEYGTSYLLAQLEEDFEVDFDFYVKFNLEGFRYLVDEIGGVPFDVPQRMYYTDPDQDLYIDLQPGMQTLNGKQAEGVVRYRRADEANPISKGYPMGDLDREKVQHDFIKAFVKQLTSLNNLTKSLPAMLQTATKYTETNFKLSQLGMFLPFLTDYSESNLELYTMPYEFETISGTEYVKPLEPDTSALIDKIFYPNQLAPTPVSSKNLDIQVLNGSYTSGLATKKANMLRDDGLNVSYVGDYQGEKINQTIIYVKDSAYGADLKKYFNNPKISLDNTIETDIMIVIGTDDSL